ncbi:hypothetical protein M8494_05385 [Serratia ureilytica]
MSHNSDTALCAVHRERGLGGVGLDVETLLSDVQARRSCGGDRFSGGRARRCCARRCRSMNC